MFAYGKKLTIGAMVILLSGLPAVASQDKEEPEQRLPMVGDAAHGTRLYRMNCTLCHGFSGAGPGSLDSMLQPKPADHQNGSLMNARDNRLLYQTIQKGCVHRGCSKNMPAFGSGLDKLELWDLVAYLRTLHFPLTHFFADLDRYVVKQYHIGHEGPPEFRQGQLERLAKYAPQWEKNELKQFVFTLFKAEQPAASPILVPQIPRQLATLKKRDKLGYVLFLTIYGPRKKPVPIGLAIDGNYSIVKLQTTAKNVSWASLYNRKFEKYLGLGKRGDAIQFTTGRDKVSRHLDKQVQQAYWLAVEAANSYEREERDRSWADGAF